MRNFFLVVCLTSNAFADSVVNLWEAYPVFTRAKMAVNGLDFYKEVDRSALVLWRILEAPVYSKFRPEEVEGAGIQLAQIDYVVRRSHQPGFVPRIAWHGASEIKTEEVVVTDEALFYIQYASGRITSKFLDVQRKAEWTSFEKGKYLSLPECQAARGDATAETQTQTKIPFLAACVPAIDPANGFAIAVHYLFQPRGDYAMGTELH